MPIRTENTIRESLMGIQKILNAEAQYGVPVKIFTTDIDSESIEQLKKWRNCNLFIRILQ